MLPAQPTAAPRVTRKRSRLLRALVRAIGLVAVGGVLVAGWAIASSPAQREPASPWRLVALGPVTLEVPAEWQPATPPAAGVPGLPESAGYATEPGLQAQAVLAIAPAGRSPAAVLERFLGPLGAPRRSQVAGRPARTFAARPVKGDRVAEVTLAPTAAGTLVIVCVARSVSWSAAAGCAEDLRPRSLEVDPAAA